MEITFEQPLNECMRLCLKLESLMKEQALYTTQYTENSSLKALIALVKTLDLVQRPDLKSKLTKALSQHATNLAQLEQFTHVDQSQLSKILSQLDMLISMMHQHRDRLANPLRENEFLNQVRLLLAHPGGICPSLCPSLQFWLQRSLPDRIADLKTWMNEFEHLNNVVNILLHITRGSVSQYEAIAANGFYHQTLNPALPSDMLQVVIHQETGVYPEFSVGRHRLNVRFCHPQYHGNGRPTQSKEDIPFILRFCRV